MSADNDNFCVICNELFNLGRTDRDHVDRRPVLTPNCCGQTLCLECAETHRAAKIGELSGNKKKIPCPMCQAPFHSVEAKFIPNRYVMRKLESLPSTFNVSRSMTATFGRAALKPDSQSKRKPASPDSMTRERTDAVEQYPVGQKIRKFFAGHGTFVGGVVKLPRNNFPFYFVRYSDGDQEHIPASELSQYVVVNEMYTANQYMYEEGPPQSKKREENTLPEEEMAERVTLSNAVLECGNQGSRKKAGASIIFFLEGFFYVGVWEVSKASFDPSLLERTKFNAENRRYEGSALEDDFISQSMLALFLFRYAHGISVLSMARHLSPWRDRDGQCSCVSPLTNLWKQEIASLQNSKKLGKTAFERTAIDDFDSFAKGYPLYTYSTGWGRRSRCMRSNLHLLAEQASVQFATYMSKHHTHSLYTKFACFLLRKVAASPSKDDLLANCRRLLEQCESKRTTSGVREEMGHLLNDAIAA